MTHNLCQCINDRVIFSVPLSSFIEVFVITPRKNYMIDFAEILHNAGYYAQPSAISIFSSIKDGIRLYDVTTTKSYKF